jgi:hypothetical protein
MRGFFEGEEIGEENPQRESPCNEVTQQAD